MKKLFILIFFSLAVCESISAQFSLVEFNLIKEIKLLESDRNDVRKILAEYNLDYSDESRHYQGFSAKNVSIRVWYSSGKCSEPSDEWSITAGKVTQIDIYPKTSIKPDSLEVNTSKLKKERMYKNLRNAYLYFSKQKGIGLEVIKNNIETIYLSPSNSNASLFCCNEEVKNEYLSEKWYDDDLKERIFIREPRNDFPDVEEIALSNQIVIICPSSDSNPKIKCDALSQQIKIITIAADSENDPLVYEYEVSGGKIIGKGARVIWDLSGVAAGTYEITASVDDGCGFCGKPKTKAITVKN